MSVSRIEHLLVLVILGCLAFPVLAQNSTDTPAPNRDASFLTPEQVPAPTDSSAFSGLATEPPVPIAPPIAPSPQPAEKAPDIIAPPVTAAPLPEVSAESVGMQNADNLGAMMWKGTPRVIASALLSIAAPTDSPVLNNLAKRLLTTAAVPPEGEAEGTPSLTSLRTQRLLAFGASAEAWSLAKHADAKLVDDATMQSVVENLLATDGEDICAQLPNLIQTRSTANWQKASIICQLRAKDTKAAQVGLDVMRTVQPRDSIFLEIADKNILGTEKTLPFQLTPLTATTLALLRMTDKPLPGELYGHPDWALAPALMRTTPKQDVAQMGLAEHAAERGLIGSAAMENVYRSAVFTPEELASPLTAHETGLRERALYFRAADGEKSTAKRIAYALQFTQSAAPAFLNGAGGVIAADMLGAIQADAAMQENAAAIAYIYMLANRGDAALDWLRLARSSAVNADILQKLWPQFALAGLEAESDYNADFDKWLTAALTPGSPQEDPRLGRDTAASSMLLLDAAGFKTPNAAWVKVIAVPHNEKHIAFSPALFDRLQAAGIAGRCAETILLATDLAGDSAISLPAAVAITRALREAGFKNEAALFARQTVALMMKQS